MNTHICIYIYTCIYLCIYIGSSRERLITFFTTRKKVPAEIWLHKDTPLISIKYHPPGKKTQRYKQHRAASLPPPAP